MAHFLPLQSYHVLDHLGEKHATKHTCGVPIPAASTQSKGNKYSIAAGESVFFAVVGWKADRCNTTLTETIVYKPETPSSKRERDHDVGSMNLLFILVSVSAVAPFHSVESHE